MVISTKLANFYLGYVLNDGIVPLVSAFNYGHPNGFVEIDPPNGENDYDHSQMVEDKGHNVLFDKIEHVLITTISGQITCDGTGLTGVSVMLTGASSVSTKTDASGNYNFNVVANGSYTITPSMTGYTFSPISSSITVNNANVTGQNFTATAFPIPTQESPPDNFVITRSSSAIYDENGYEVWNGSSNTVNFTFMLDMTGVGNVELRCKFYIDDQLLDESSINNYGTIEGSIGFTEPWYNPTVGTHQYYFECNDLISGNRTQSQIRTIIISP